MSVERLDSWKEIAAYLKRDVATVRRWEKREALPVHRHVHQKLGSVYAYTSELDAWLEGRRQRLTQQPAIGLRQRVALIAALVAAIVSSYLVWRTVDGGSARAQVRIAIHRPGTVASLISEGLRDVLVESIEGLDVELVEQPGMVSTMRAIDSAQVDLGFAFNLLAFHAVKTDELLGHRSDRITALTVAYATPAQIVVRAKSDVQKVTDLKGRRVSLGIAESGERFSSQIVLAHFGLDSSDLIDRAADFAPSLKGLRDGELDAYITWRGVPVPDLSEAFTTGSLRLVPLDADAAAGLAVKHPFLVPWTIPARVYAHQSEPIPTVSGRILLLAARSLSPDLVERILRAIDARLPDLVARHPAAAEINLRERPTLAQGLSIDLHPGATRFFDSISGR